MARSLSTVATSSVSRTRSLFHYYIINTLAAAVALSKCICGHIYSNQIF